MIDAATLGQAAAGFGVLAGGAYAGWQSRRARTEAKRAADNAHPVSNGWGTKVAADLEYLRSSVDTVMRMQATEGQARVQIQRELSATRKHARTAAEQAAAVATGLAAHLADHASNDAREATPL